MNPVCYKTVLFKMFGTQLRVLGWAVPITSLSLNGANPTSLQSIIFRKLMEAISFSADGITTGCNATSWHVFEFGIAYFATMARYR